MNKRTIKPDEDGRFEFTLRKGEEVEIVWGGKSERAWSLFFAIVAGLNAVVAIHSATKGQWWWVIINGGVALFLVWRWWIHGR